MNRSVPGKGSPPWASFPTELVQDICSFLNPSDLAAASLTCRAWRTAACALVTHIMLPLNHPLLIAGPAKGWEESVQRLYGRQLQGLATPDDAGAGASSAYVSPQRPGWTSSSGRAGGDGAGGPGSSQGHPGASDSAMPSAGPATPPHMLLTPLAARPCTTDRVPLPRLRTDFPYVTHITLVHNALLHRAQVHAALSTLRVLWPTVRGLSVHDSVTWDLPLDYSALGVMTHITSLELLFQGQGGMDEAGQPMYRASMPHLCRLHQLKELCMKWIIGYDVDSFLDFNEVYDLLASLVRHDQLRSLQFGGENINAEGARHLASITTLETLNLVCDARPASPLHLLDLLTMPRLTRLELMHVCPDHAWNLEPLPGEPQDPLAELKLRSHALTSSPLRCLALSLSPRCQALISRALPLLPHLHSLSVRVTSTDEEEALCSAFRAMVESGPPTPPSPPPPPPAGPADQAGLGAGLGPVPFVPFVSTPVARALTGTAAETPPSSIRTVRIGPPPLRSLRLETAELGADLIGCVAMLTALTSLQLPRGLPTGETVEYAPAPAAAVAGAEPPQPQNKYAMAHLSSLGRLTNLRRLMLQLDSPADTPPAFVDGSLVSVLTGLTALESLHLSTWNLVGQDPSAEALGPYPQRQEQNHQHDDDHPGGRQEQQREGPAGVELGSSERDKDAQALAGASHSGSSSSGGCDGGAAAQQPGGSMAGAEHARAPAAAGKTSAAGQGLGLPASGSSTGPDGGSGGGAAGAAAETGTTSVESRRGRGLAAAGAAAAAPCLAPLPTWAWHGLRSLSLTHWPCVYGKLRELGPPQPGRSYAVRLDDLPSTLEALLLVRCQLAGSRPPPALRHLWLADCIATDSPLPQLLTAMRQLETLVLRWPSTPEDQEPAAEAVAARQRAQLVAAVATLRSLRTLGLGGIRCQDVPSLAPLTQLRHLMLEPSQPQRPPGEAPSAQRDLTLLDQLMALPAGAMAGLRTLWLPNWAMPIKQLLQWQQMLQAAMPLVVLRVIEYDVVWTVPTPVMHVARVEAPSSLRSGSPAATAAAAAAAATAAGPGARAGGRPGRWSECGGGSPQRGAPTGLGGVDSRQHAGWGLDGQELEWWHIGCWTVQ